MLDRDRTPLPPRRRAHLLRYALWQLRDYVTNQGAATLLVPALIGWMALKAATQTAGRGAEHPMREIDPTVLGLVRVQLTGTLVFIGALFATNGMVSGDRKAGFHRFYFAKPVSPPAFYGQQLVVHTLGFVAAAHLLYVAFLWLTGTAFAPRFPLLVTLMFIAYAGLGFLMSTVSRIDWLSLIAVVFASQILWRAWGSEPGWRGAAARVLPPLPRVDEVYAAMFGTADVPWRLVGWLAGYGAAAFVAGLLVLRHRALGAGA